MDRCEAITKTGTQCSRKHAVGSIFCAQHKNYTGPLASGNINVAPEAKTQSPPSRNISIVKVKEVQEVKEKAIPELYSELNGELDVEQIDEILSEITITVDDNPDNNDILEDSELMEQVIGKGEIMIFLPVGEDPVTVDKTLFYDATWEDITIGEILQSVIAEYNTPITTELTELKEKAERLGEDEILGSLEDVEDAEKLYELNLGSIVFKGLEKISETHAIYKVLLDFQD